MATKTELENLAAAIAADIKGLLANQGALSALTTTAKTSLVAALNELKTLIDSAAGGGALIDDTATGATNADNDVVWSAYKVKTSVDAAIAALVNGAPTALDTLKELADELSGQDSAIGALTTALGNRVRYDAAQTLTSAQMTTAQQNIGLGNLEAWSAANSGAGGGLVDIYETARDS
jgi:hypothetical protein